MDHQEELDDQSLGICNRLYNFIMKILARHAFKSMTLGTPVSHSFPISDSTQNNRGPSKSQQMVHPMPEEQANDLKNPDPVTSIFSSCNEHEKESEEEPVQGQDVAAAAAAVADDDIVFSASKIDEKHASCIYPGKRLEEEAQSSSNATQAKAPKKMVSINDQVEEIYTGKQNHKRKKKVIEKVTSMVREDDEPKPLRSILKVGSNLSEKLERY